MMLSRIATRAAGRLSKQGLQALSAANQSTSASTPQVIRPELVIKSAYKPSGNHPDLLEYDNIPVDVFGTKVAVPDYREMRVGPPAVTELCEPEPLSLDKKSEEASDEKETEGKLEDQICVWFGHDMPTIYDDQLPERDVVNYPREPYTLQTQPDVRLKMIPESYFKFFHDRTGVTGPYMLIGTYGTFIISKEYLVLANELYSGSALAVIIGTVAYKWGKDINNYLTGSDIKADQAWLDWQDGMIKFLEKYIEHHKNVKHLSINQDILFQAKRENIALQREAEFRRRQMVAFQEAKRKLDYHVAVEEAQKQFAQGHLVNWVIDNVNKSITPELQNLVLQQSLNDLKTLSQKRRNAF